MSENLNLDQEDHLDFLPDLPIEMLDKIMSYLPFRSLKSLRRVSRTWDALATSYILRSDACSVRLRWDHNANKYSQDLGTAQNTRPRIFPSRSIIPTNFPATSPSSIQRLSLDDLTDSLHQAPETGIKFPCTSFQFRGGPLDSLDAEIFFAQNGHLIKTLVIKFERGATKMETLFKLLGEKCPNVQSLRLFEIRYIIIDENEATPPATNPNLNPIESSDTKAKVAPTIQLPNLRSLTLGYNDTINYNERCIAEIFAAAPNLEFYEGTSSAYDVHYVALFSSHKKMHTIKTLTFEPGTDNLEFYSRFASDPNFKLKSLSIFPRHDRMRDADVQASCNRALSQILKGSHDSLLNLSINSPLTFLRDVDWPEMKKVKWLTIGFKTYFKGFNTQIFADNSNFQSWLNAKNIFTNLTTVTFDGYSLWSDWQKSLGINYFPFLNEGKNCSLMTVRRLNIQKNVPRGWLARFPHIFPNVNFLKWEELKNLPEVAELIWSFKAVTDLEFELVLGDARNDNSFPKLDAAFTGFSVEDCEALVGVKGDEMEVTRVRPSVVQMDHLKDVKITLRDMEDEVRESYNLFSGQLTGEFAFKLMEQVAVRIEIKAQTNNAQKIFESLQSMVPYARIEVHEAKEKNLHIVTDY